MRVGNVALFMVLAGLTLVPAAGGQNPLAAARAQLETALFYAADLAQRGTAVSATHLHLRQVINCLEGPQGRNFIAAAGNPCRQQGNGILVDLGALERAGSAQAGVAFRFATASNTFALQGVAAHDVNEAQTYAAMTAFDLNNALETLK